MTETLYSIGIFSILQLINVMLNTGKTLIMTRTDSPHMAAIINAVTFGFYTMVVKQVANLDLSITVTVTVITNIIGVYVAYYVMQKLKKDNLWKIEIFSRTQLAEIIRDLHQTNISYTPITPQVLTVYAYTQKDSEEVARIIKKHNAKSNITEITKKF